MSPQIQAGTPPTLIEQLAAYAEEVRRTVPEVPKSGLEWALGQKGLVRREGAWIEFGVNEGGTLNAIAPYRDDAVLWGFDSCRGLPEKWNADHPKGMFAMVRPPLPPDGVNLVVGWFKDTLRAFEPAEPVTFVHLDCDLYSSAVTVLAWLVVGVRRDDKRIMVREAYREDRVAHGRRHRLR